MPRTSRPCEPASRRKHDDQPAYRTGSSRSRISPEWYAASGTSLVPTRYRSSASSRYTSLAWAPRKPVPSIASGRTSDGVIDGVKPCSTACWMAICSIASWSSAPTPVRK
jgi:hypothetical protein